LTTHQQIANQVRPSSAVVFQRAVNGDWGYTPGSGWWHCQVPGRTAGRPRFPGRGSTGLHSWRRVWWWHGGPTPRPERRYRPRVRRL